MTDFKVVTLTKTSIADFWLTPTIPIVKGTDYKIEWNPTNGGSFWIYTVWGCSQISKRILDRFFI